MSLHDAARSILVREVMEKLHADSSHSIEHYDRVVGHSLLVLEELSLSEAERDAVILACLLHDVDDTKVTKGESPPLYWAKYVLDKLCVDSTAILLMIDLVSCSKNGDSHDESYPWWYYVPRYCDRLDAIGEVGIERLLAYGRGIGRPLRYSDTVRVYNREELSIVASAEKYIEYTKGGEKERRVSSVDIIYDKLYHISLPEWMQSEYLRSMFESRKDYVAEWVINYWLCETR